jgi:multiphosphoryl transfer protein
MVGLVIVSHSSKLAQGVVELARSMGGPDLPIRAAGGLDLPDSPLGTDAALILQAIQEVYSPDGVLVLMDLGSAILSAEMALELLPPEQGSNVWLCEAPLVEGAVSAAVQARLGSPVEQVLAEARRALLPKIAQLGAEAPATATETPSTPTLNPDERLLTVHELTLTVPNRLGLHARPAARFVQTAARFPDARVSVQNLTTGSAPVDARSINSLATLGVRQGHSLRVSASGAEAHAALAALQQLAEQNFGDEETGPGSFQPEAGDAPQAGHRLVQPGGLLQGLPVSPGIALGPVRRVQRRPLSPPDYPAAAPDAEWAALQAAIKQTKTRLQAARQAAAQRLGDYPAAIFVAHLLSLDDPALLDPARSAIFDSGSNAAAAWVAAVEQVAASYRRLQDEYLRQRSADVESVGQQVLEQLLQERSPDRPSEAPLLSLPGILVAAELSPAETALLDPALALGICSALGGPTSHSAILARSLGIPAIAGLGEALLQVPEGTPLLMDGGSGQVWLDPGPDIAAEYAGRAAAARQAATDAREASVAPAITRDGRRIEMGANIGSPADARLAVACGADSVGLFRTEFLFLNRPQAPDEDEQYTAYRLAAEALVGRPLTIRTLDAGGDKPLPYLDLPVEANPYLGWRAIRISLERSDFFKQQLRAILRLAGEFPVRVLFPMIATLDEWRRAKRLLEQARLELSERGQAVPDLLPAGMMVETPAAALRIEQFAAEADFFSIGSNDLAQYTLAAERGNPRLAHLTDPLQPALIQLIGQVIEAAHRHGKPVALCGEMAADPPAAALLTGLGVDELSMNPLALPQLKQLIRGWEYRALIDLALGAHNLESAAAVRQAFQDYRTG